MGEIRIAGQTTLDEVSRLPVALLAEAARLSCASLLRNRVTVAEAVSSPAGHGELVAALLVMDAKTIRDEQSRLVEVLFPETSSEWHGGRERIVSTPAGRPVLSVTALLRLDGSRISGCRLAVAGAGLMPMRIPEIEAAVAGGRSDLPHSSLPQFAGAKDAEYCRAMLPVLVNRVVDRCKSV